MGSPVRQVNKIRESLGVVVRNSTAYGLRQPHLERTRLCQLSDADLDPVYVRQRSGLRNLVRQLAKPKLLNGEVREPTPMAFFCSIIQKELDRTSGESAAAQQSWRYCSCACYACYLSRVHALDCSYGPG